jgi:hypothetical protein
MSTDGIATKALKDKLIQQHGHVVVEILFAGNDEPGIKAHIELVDRAWN